MKMDFETLYQILAKYANDHGYVLDVADVYAYCKATGILLCD